MKAIALISGGLDSILAARLVKEEGIEVIALHFKIPFAHSQIKKPCSSSTKINELARNLGLELKVVELTGEFLEIIRNPQYGFGANINPCIDCKILMLRKAKELMKESGASFLITGEVLAQRPMSQNKQTLKIIERESGLEGLLLRPLSAQLLEETIPEKKGWVKRERLLSFSGRSRSPQISLANSFEIKNYPNAAGGCLLTDPQFTKRLKELIGHEELNMDNIGLLKLGRHFRIGPQTKLIVGRDEKENQELVNLVKEDDYLFFPGDELAGATALGRGKFNEELINFSCRIACRYCDLEGKTSADLIYKRLPGKEERVSGVLPLEESGLINFRI